MFVIGAARMTVSLAPELPLQAILSLPDDYKSLCRWRAGAERLRKLQRLAKTSASR